MDAKIVSALNPAYIEFYMAPLREHNLRVYTKELNIDAWIRIDIWLNYDDEGELDLAREVIRDIEQPGETPGEG